MKKFFKGLLVIIILAAVTVGILLLSTPYYNNQVLNKFANRFEKMDLPEDTVLITSVSTIGNLKGEENSIDYLAAIVIKSDKSLAELEDFYKDQYYYNAKASHKEININIERLKTDKLNDVYELNEEIIISELSGISDLSNYFVIVQFDGGYSAGFDWRGR